MYWLQNMAVLSRGKGAFPRIQPCASSEVGFKSKMSVLGWSSTSLLCQCRALLLPFAQDWTLIEHHHQRNLFKQSKKRNIYSRLLFKHELIKGAISSRTQYHCRKSRAKSKTISLFKSALPQKVKLTLVLDMLLTHGDTPNPRAG